MEYKLQRLEPTVTIDNHSQETCPKCKQVQKRYFICVCLLCVFFAVINLMVIVFVLGRSNDRNDSDIVKQLHALQARVQDLEEISSKSLSVTNEAHHKPESLKNEVFHTSTLTEMLFESRVKRNADKRKKPKPNKQRHKSCCKRKTVEAIQVEGMVEINNEPVDHWAYGTFHKFEYADWFFNQPHKAKEKQFELNFPNGKLTVKQSGLYLLYSQITLKGNGTHGYHVIRNDKSPILACYSNNMMLHDEDKTSCFTMGMVKLDKGDTIEIRHISKAGIRAVFTSNASFFGLIKVGVFNKKGVVFAV
ncbi:protein eiger-like isoform X3 [Saccostrea cucullata]|uniref:protein eiger-like isoform X3 n=1 Tax=Saccostrea cuccullata TaxID=36930 RepID=UPI002ED1E55B